jgi:hypothetical protein
MKLKNFLHSIIILYLIVLFSAVRYYNDPAYADIGEAAENEYQTSAALTTHYTLVVADWSHRTNPEHKDFLKFALTLNEVKHGESEDNSVQRMREDKHEMPEYWFWHEGWQELSLDQKRTLLAGSMTFLNWYMKENKLFNERERAQYDQFSARVTVEEIVNHVESMYKRPQYQDKDAENIIIEYMLNNFCDYIGQTIFYPG